MNQFKKKVGRRKKGIFVEGGIGLVREKGPTEKRKPTRGELSWGNLRGEGIDLTEKKGEGR